MQKESPSRLRLPPTLSPIPITETYSRHEDNLEGHRASTELTRVPRHRSFPHTATASHADQVCLYRTTSPQRRFVDQDRRSGFKISRIRSVSELCIYRTQRCLTGCGFSSTREKSSTRPKHSQKSCKPFSMAFPNLAIFIPSTAIS